MLKIMEQTLNNKYNLLQAKLTQSTEMDLPSLKTDLLMLISLCEMYVKQDLSDERKKRVVENNALNLNINIQRLKTLNEFREFVDRMGKKEKEYMWKMLV